MATSKEKFQLIFEAKEAASRKIRDLNKQLADLGGPKMVKSQKAIRKLEREVKLLSGTTTKGKGVFSRFTQGIAVGNIVATATAKAFSMLQGVIKRVADEIGDATMMAAEIEELGGVLNFVGQRAGYSGEEIEGYVKKLRKAGIAQKEANQSLLRAIQGHIDFADAIKLGRIAQDAAVIGQMNSSEAFQTLIDAVVKGRVVMLKSLGIQGTFEQSYKELAKSLGKAAAHLTEAEKRQARLNLVFKGGEDIAGTYEKAMGYASKQLRSLPRLFQDVQQSIGQYFVPAMGVGVTETGRLLKEITAAFGDKPQSDINQISYEIGMIASSLALVAKLTWNLGQISLNMWQLTFIDPIKSVVVASKALYTALADPFSIDAWKQAGTTVSGIFDGFKTDFGDIEGDVADMQAAIATFAIDAIGMQAKVDKAKEEFQAKAEADAAQEEIINLEAAATEKRLAMLDAIIGKRQHLAMVMEEEGEMAFIDEDDIILSEMMMARLSDGVEETVRAAKDKSQDMGQQMQSMMGGAINNMVNGMVSGRATMSGIFKGMAQDFTTFFIKQALASTLNMFVPGLGSILGGMFDTPVNDRMAANQGRDFMKWFTRGALAETQGGSEMAVGITHSANRIIPVASGGGDSTGGMVVMNVNVSGNVMTDQYVEKTIAPRLQSLVNDGRSLLKVQDENKTGGRDVSIN